MARTALTLAASVTSALPRTGVVSVAALTENALGRFDSAVATLDDGRRVVIRVPVDAEAGAELAADVRSLRALTPGVRAVLPFAAPDVLGETTVDGLPAVVQNLLEGYRVDAVHVPAGEGVATAIGAVIANIHNLPLSVVRDGGLPQLSSTQARDDAERLLDRAEATGKLPFGLLRRWSTAIGTKDLWHFESTVTLGGVEPSAFVLTDTDRGPTVTGLLSWRGLSIGDPAADLRWTASAPNARDDALRAYAAASHHAPDARLVDRTRLYAELEFAKWLVHGHTTGSETVLQDAVSLLESLDDSVRDEPLLAASSPSVDDAIALMGRVPDNASDALDTSMQTDAYDAAALAEFLDDDAATGQVSPLESETEPIELTEWAPLRSGIIPTDVAPPAETTAAGINHDDPNASAENALRRWTGTA